MPDLARHEQPEPPRHYPRDWQAKHRQRQPGRTGSIPQLLSFVKTYNKQRNNVWVIL